MKKLLSLLVSFALLSSMSINAFAEPEISEFDDSQIAPCYLYTSSISSPLGIKNKTAECTSLVYGYYPEVTKIEVTQYLQIKAGNNWQTYTTWSKTYNTWQCCFGNTKSSLPSGTFRLKTSANVYKGSKYETVTAYSFEVKS